MTFFASREEFSNAHAGTTKWDRFLLALDNADSIGEGVAHSIGDSLTYWRDTADRIGHEDLVGHRRYETVLVGIEGDTPVDVAPQAGLTATEAYDDLTDRQWFTPPDPDDLTSIPVGPGQILVVPIDHAWRVRPRTAARVLTARVTVEGATFHNK